ncbi:MAG: lysostaphin resistance A-like protein [Acidobacteriota bacterium]
MTASELFINPKEGRLRAAWRMAIFIAAFMLLNSGVFAVLIPLLTSAGIVRSRVLFTVITYLVVTVVTWGVCRWIDRRPLRSVGLGFHDRTLVELSQGLALGALMMGVIFLAITASGMAEFHWKDLSWTQAAWMAAVSFAEFAAVAWGEELLFRGYLFQTLAEGTTRITAVAVFAVFFGVVHMGNPNVTFFSLVNIAIAGVWLSAAYFKTRGLWLPVGLHFSWNFFQNHVFSFPVSGIQMSETQLGTVTDRGPEWLTGGAFGPEGGAIATVMLLAGSAFIWFSPAIRPSAWAWVKWPAPGETKTGQVLQGEAGSSPDAV